MADDGIARASRTPEIRENDVSETTVDTNKNRFRKYRNALIRSRLDRLSTHAQKKFTRTWARFFFRSFVPTNPISPEIESTIYYIIAIVRAGFRSENVACSRRNS